MRSADALYSCFVSSVGGSVVPVCSSIVALLAASSMGALVLSSSACTAAEADVGCSVGVLVTTAMSVSSAGSVVVAVVSAEVVRVCFG